MPKKENRCFICNNPAEITPMKDQGRIFECPRCGVFTLEYDIFTSLQSTAIKKRLTASVISNISGWLQDNQPPDGTRFLPSFPGIDKDLIEKFLSSKPLDVYEKAYKLLKWLNQKTTYPGERIKIQDIYNCLELTAICYAYDHKEIKYLLKYLAEVKYISTLVAAQDIEIKPAGFSYLEGYNKNFDSNTGFCAMWFDQKMGFLWDEAIEPAIKGAGYDAKRIDKHPHNGAVVDEIIALIRRSRFIVSDLTGHRNGVYFEAGFAKGLGLEVIFTCNQQDYDHIHFDVQHYNFIFWERHKIPEFREKLQNRIQATLGRGRNLD